jgi:2-dehydro-3-deoxy-D-arabinonate dehydratase
MKLYKVSAGVVVLHDGKYFLLRENWDTLVNRDHLHDHVLSLIAKAKEDGGLVAILEREPLPPIGSQEVWAAGVTYHRSKEARMEESKTSGADVFYDHVYDAVRPEIFFKAIAQRVVGHGGVVNIRRDSTWNVPEPELTLFINTKGSIQGYTIGNDMSSRSIEGENPLYLPQAKSYDRSAGLGPCLYVPKNKIPPDTKIFLEITRNAKVMYQDSVQIDRMKRTHTELTEFLFRECDFPFGCYLMTGTCLVPPNSFTLAVNDVVNISIDGIGTLTQTIGMKS